MQRKSLAFTAVALLALAACTADSPTGVQAGAGDAPAFAKTKGTPETVAGARFIAGNISGNGDAVCRTLGVGGSGFKVDGGNSATIAGYRFTVSADGRYLTFTQVTPGSSIVAVLVKGGPDGFLYEYAAGEPSRTMRSPLNGGGNIPGISHYTVCFKPTPPTGWTLEKKILGYWKSMAMGPGDFVPGTTVTFPAGCAAFANDIHAAEAAGCVRWIEYDVVATKIGGGPGDPAVLVFDDMKTACENLALARQFRVYCDYPNRSSLPWTTFFNGGESTSATKTWHYVLDLWNKGDCGTYTLTNTASLAEPGKPVLTSAAVLTIVNPNSCPAP